MVCHGRRRWYQRQYRTGPKYNANASIDCYRQEMKNRKVLLLTKHLAQLFILSLAVASCVRTVQSGHTKLDAVGAPMILELIASQTSLHRGSDDLLSAGLGAAGLRNPVAPAFDAPENPSAAELRRRAIWTNWRGIADLSVGGGYDEFYGSLTAVPGREFHALALLPKAKQPIRVLVQLPDAFDLAKSVGAGCQWPAE